MIMKKNCPYCGCERIINVPEEASDAAVYSALVHMCDCNDAVREAARLDIDKTVNALFGEESKAKYQSFYPEHLREMIKLIALDVHDKRFQKISITLMDGDKCNIRKDKNLAVKVSRVQQRKDEL